LSTSLVSPTRISASTEAHECYDLLCGQRQIADDVKKRRILIFTDTVQACYCAAVVGHLLQRGERYLVKAKAKEGLILIQQWERKEKSDLRKALTFLTKLEYGVSEPDEVLQVVAELAEVGIRHIREKVFETGDFEWTQLVEELRKDTVKRGELRE
jgi:hypothetical protein